METLTPGIIPRSEFIHWQTIDEKIKSLEWPISFYRDLAQRIKEGAKFKTEFRDSLLASDSPLPLVSCGFQLLGHTGDNYVSNKDDVSLDLISQHIFSKHSSQAEYLAGLFTDLGLAKVLARSDLGDLLLGIQIGLETHRRKNVGGTNFKNRIAAELQKIAASLQKKGFSVELLEEHKIKYDQRQSKKVDFYLLLAGKHKFGIEVNFYTGPGSKPTEIKRSYGEILRGLKKVGVDLIWVTDGKGYSDMHRSLGDAFEIVPNIFNMRQMVEHLESDLLRLGK
jgi:hypothetical protein